MKLATILIAALGVYCQDWHTIKVSVPSGAQITEFSGKMKVPPLIAAGTYYLWPGIQPNPAYGVLQSVLDGRSGTWWLGSGWVGSVHSYPWGNAFNVYAGQVIDFRYRRHESGWSITVNDTATGGLVTSSFPGLGKFTFSFLPSLFSLLYI